jgi:hypothetical protein
MHQLDKWNQTTQLAPRPTSSGFIGPCTYCPLKELCHRAEVQGLTTTDIEAEAVELIEAKVGPTPKINKEK